MVKSADEREHARAAGSVIQSRRRRHREDQPEDEEIRGRNVGREDERGNRRSVRSRSRVADTSVSSRRAELRTETPQNLDEDDQEHIMEPKEERKRGRKERAGQQSAEPPAQERPQSRGLFANVLSAVTREVRSFVVTAATGNPPPPPAPQAPPSSAKAACRSASKPRPAPVLETNEQAQLVRKRVRKADGDSSAGESGDESAGRSGRRREVTRKRRPAPDINADRSSDFVEGSSSMRSKRARNVAHEPSQQLRADRSRSSTPEPTSEHEERLHSPTPSPPPSSPPQPTPFRRPATMPGSLFPRSASLQPSEPPSPEEIARRVRFVPAVEGRSTGGPEQRKPRSRSNLREIATIQEEQPDDEHTGSPANHDAPDSAQQEQSHERSRSPGDAKPPLKETSAELSVGQMSDRARGKQRATAQDPDTSSELRVRGKESELRAAREAHARILPTADEEERERDKLRINFLEEEVERLRAQLAAAKARRTTPAHSGAGPPLAPPPPPPPPPTFAVPKLPGPGKRPLSAQAARNTASFLQSARSLLKPTAPPVEAPINGPARTRKSIQPTVNVPTDKMAAFLTEVKNVRLRKVSGGANTLGTSAGSGGNLMRSASDASRSRFAAGEHSFDAGAARYGDHSFTLGTARIGEKRKRTDFAGDISVDGPERSRRRFSGFTLTELSRPGSSSGLTAGAASASNSSNSSQDSQGSGSSGPFAFTRDFRQSHAWPSIARTETDLTTPSLCSDHEPEAARGAAADNSREQGTESQESLRTPPAIEMPHGHAGHVQEIIDVDAEPDSEPSRRVTHVPEIDLRAIDAEKRHEDAFARRKPTSPLPMDTPRKPLPPARARRAREVTSAADAQKPWKEDRPVRDTRQDGERTSRGSSDHPVDVSDAESDDPLTSYSPLPLTQAPPRQAERAKATTQQSRIAKATERRGGSRQVAETNATTSEGAGTSSAVRRRRTLDEELQRAGDALWAEPEDTVDGVHAEEENGELVGVGTKSKKAGFLAGGGASGIPVFMGVGYVRGAEDSREDRRQQNNTNTRRSKSRMGGD